ncbi:MAG TPA: ROK family transcriptional regulator, partial [Limnochordia bacterium]
MSMRAVNFPGMRNINRSIVLDLIRRHGPISRGEIARRSRLAPSAVSNIVGELTCLGLVREARRAKPNGGRPAALLELRPGSAHAVGVNVGLTNIVAVCTDLSGMPIARAVLATRPADGAQAVLRRVRQSVQEAITAAGLVPQRVAGVGVGIPGLVDTGRGLSVFSPNLGWRDLPVRAPLEEALGLPIYVDNDVRAATLGESAFGAGQGAGHLVGLF